MKRLRHYFPLVSLFLGLGLANAALYYAMAKAELEWGGEEEVKARAIGLAGLYPAAAVGEQEASRLKEALARMSKDAGGFEAVYFEETAGGWSPTFLCDQSKIPTPGMPSAEALEKLRAGQAVAQRISQHGGGADIVMAFVARKEKEGKVSRIFAVAAEDRVLMDGLAGVLRICAWFVVATCVAGLLIAELIAFIFRRAVRCLEAEASRLEVEGQRPSWRPSRISEVNDLTSTMRTIGIVLQENVRQTWRRFQQDELRPRQDNLAIDYQKLCDSEELSQTQGLHLQMRRIGGGSYEEFFAVRAKADRWLVGVARIRMPAEEKPPLDRVVRAMAARDYFAALGFDDAGDLIWSRVSNVYPVEKGERVLFSQVGGGKAQVITCSAASCESVPIEADEKRFVLGTLSDEALKKAREYVRVHPGQSLETVMDTLEAFFAEEEKGLLVVFESEAR